MVQILRGPSRRKQAESHTTVIFSHYSCTRILNTIFGIRIFTRSLNFYITLSHLKRGKHKTTLLLCVWTHQEFFFASIGHVIQPYKHVTVEKCLRFIYCLRAMDQWKTPTMVPDQSLNGIQTTRDNLRLTEAFCREKAVEKILGDFQREKIIAILPHCIFFSKTRQLSP